MPWGNKDCMSYLETQPTHLMRSDDFKPEQNYCIN